ncbi:MAG: hypothetical protein COB71_07100 [Thiotrichales bacterium]|nr:MAG: hypothetical protein COB71_07100 [Thiotrichales bacterium]
MHHVTRFLKILLNDFCRTSSFKCDIFSFFPLFSSSYCNFLTGHCWVRTQEGRYTINKSLRNKIDFRLINLNEGISKVGRFYFIFLRNVMIYFDLDTKMKIVSNLIKQLNPGGYLLVGHSETLNSVCSEVSSVRPSIYRLAL